MAVLTFTTQRVAMSPNTLCSHLYELIFAFLVWRNDTLKLKLHLDIISFNALGSEIWSLRREVRLSYWKCTHSVYISKYKIEKHKKENWGLERINISIRSCGKSVVKAWVEHGTWSLPVQGFSLVDWLILPDLRMWSSTLW